MLISLYSFFFNVDYADLMVAIIVLVTFDLLTALLAAKKNEDVIESRRVLCTAFKMSIYGILVSSAHLTEEIIGLTDYWVGLERAVIAYLAATEMISIIENVGKMGFAVPLRLLNQLEKFRSSEKSTG